MIFDEKNVRTEWDDSLEGKVGYYSGFIDDGRNGCLKRYVIDEYKNSFGKVSYSGIHENPFKDEQDECWGYFYPVPEIKKQVKNESTRNKCPEWLLNAMKKGKGVKCSVWNNDKDTHKIDVIYGFFCTNDEEHNYPYMDEYCMSWKYAEPYKEPEHILKTFCHVLCRNGEDDLWVPDIFGYVDESFKGIYSCFLNNWEMCIPYEGNEKLCGTTDTPNEK